MNLHIEIGSWSLSITHEPGAWQLSVAREGKTLDANLEYGMWPDGSHATPYVLQAQLGSWSTQIAYDPEDELEAIWAAEEEGAAAPN